MSKSDEAESPVMEMFALFRRNSMTATGHSSFAFLTCPEII